MILRVASATFCRTTATRTIASRNVFGNYTKFRYAKSHSQVACFHSGIPSEDDTRKTVPHATKDGDAAVENVNLIRPKLRVKHILANMQVKKFTISENSTISDAIDHLILQNLASTLTVNGRGEVSGIFTARDILKFIKHQKDNAKANLSKESWSDTIYHKKISNIIVPKDKLVYCSPNDTARRCREIMFHLKVRNLPVIENGEVRGIINAKILADASFDLIETGGKKGFIHNISGRKGLPEGTRLSQAALAHAEHDHMRREWDDLHRVPGMSNQLDAVSLDMQIGSFALPHPFKKAEGVAMNRRLYGAHELSDDLTLCEDAHFVFKIADPAAAGQATFDNEDTGKKNGWRAVQDDGSEVSTSAVPTEYNEGDDEWGVAPPQPAQQAVAPCVPSLVYMCVADGVGSWRQYGVDPRKYSHR